MDRNHLGRRVWSLPHVRSAVLHKLPDSQLVELLTLNIESFPEVVEALYYELDKTKWMKYLLDAARRLEYPDLNRLGLYRYSVRSIDLTGTLPMCAIFPGGLERLLTIFPMLRMLVLSGELNLEIKQRKNHVEIVYGGMVDDISSLEQLQHHATLTEMVSALGGQPVVYRYQLTVEAIEFGMGLHLDCIHPRALHKALEPLDYENSNIFEFETALRASSVNNKIEWLEFGTGISYTEFQSCLGEGGGTITSSIERLAGWFYVDLHELELFLQLFDGTTFSKLGAVDLRVDVAFEDWQEMEHLDRLWDLTRPPLPSLETFRLRLLFRATSDCAHQSVCHWQEKGNPHWLLQFAPDPQWFSRRIVSIGGPSCDYDIGISFNCCPVFGNTESSKGCNESSTAYTNVVRQEIFKLRQGESDTNGQ